MQKKTQKNKIRLALIGAGDIGKIWAAAIPKTKGVALRAVVDTNTKAAQALAEQFSDCRAASLEEILADKTIDALIIGVPHHLLAPIAQKALKKNRHVLSEKPGGITAASVAKNQRLAQKNKLVYMIGVNHRYHAAYLKAKELCDKGTIGNLLCIRAQYGFGGRPGYNKEWRFNKKIAGGGELIDQGIHLIDLSRHFLGEITDIEGYTPNLYWGGQVEDNAFIHLRTKDGKIAQLHASWTNWDWIHHFEIFGTKGYLRIDGLDSRYHGPERLTIGTHNPKGKAFPKESVITFAKEKKEDSLARELALFADAVRGKKVNYPNGEDAVRALSLIERVYRANKKYAKKITR